jgi:hypothetical protein
MTVASFVSSLLALVVAVVAVWYGRGQKRAADLSAAEAKRAADAAAEVAEIERARRADEVADADRRRVRFVLVPAGSQAYVLRNAGIDTAYGVHVDARGWGLEDEVTDFEEFESGSEQRYWLIRKGGGADQAEHVLVTWHHRPDRSDGRRSAKSLVL